MNTDKIAAGIQMVGSRTTSLTLVNNFTGIENTADYKRIIDISHKINYIQKQEGDAPLYIGAIELNVEATISKDEEEFRIITVLEGAFLGDGKAMDEDTFRKMISINGVTALYSIVRANIIQVSSIALASGSVILPMINVTKYSKLLDEEGEA